MIKNDAVLNEEIDPKLVEVSDAFFYHLSSIFVLFVIVGFFYIDDS